MSLRLRRGTDSDRQSGIIFDPGELVYTTDTKKLYIGDGVTNGGTHVLKTSAGVGLVWDDGTQTLNIGTANLSTAYVQEDSTHLYFTTERAQDAAASLLTHSNHSGIAFYYDDVNNQVYSSITAHVQNDPTPVLGGDLDLSGNSITGDGNINITGSYSNQNLTLTNNHIYLADDNGFVIHSNAVRVLEIRSLAKQTLQGVPHIAMNISNGTLEDPTPVGANDYLGGMLFRGYNSSSNYSVTSGLYSKMTSTADIDTSFPQSILTIFTGTNSSTPNNFEFNHHGVFSAPILKTASYAGTSFYPANPEEGWIIYDSSTKHFIGYAGSTNGWVILG